MATVVSQHGRHLGRHLGFFKNFIFSKIAANFLENNRKHVFTASSRNIVKNRVEKKTGKFCQKVTVNVVYLILIIISLIFAFDFSAPF